MVLEVGFSSTCRTSYLLLSSTVLYERWPPWHEMLILLYYLPFASKSSFLAPINPSLHFPVISTGPYHFSSTFWFTLTNFLNHPCLIHSDHMLKIIQICPFHMCSQIRGFIQFFLFLVSSLILQTPCSIHLPQSFLLPHISHNFILFSHGPCSHPYITSGFNSVCRFSFLTFWSQFYT
jgi:hypothetical protein